MKHIKTFESFINEAAINKNYKGDPELTHWYKGNPILEMPMADLLEELRNYFKMSKRDFPSNKPEFHIQKGGEVKTPDGFTIYWYKSTPPNIVLVINREDGDAKKMELIKEVVDDILSKYSGVPISKPFQDAWNNMPADVKEILETAWTPALEAKHIMTVLDTNSIKFDYTISSFSKSKLPRGFVYIDDPKTTNFSVKTPKRTVSFQIHRSNTWTIVTW